MSLLSATGLQGGYGSMKVLVGVDLTVGEGEVVALAGRNGMGKTTTIRMLTGALPSDSGRIEFARTDTTRMADYKIARLGIGLVPEGRQVFTNLMVEENLLVAEKGARGEPSPLEAVYTLFPRLRERRTQRASTLSGGEQQMLAIGRALMTRPRLLILDEATEGLAPLIRTEIWNCLADIARSGVSVLVVDKDIRALGNVADRVVVISKGKTIWEGKSSDFVTNEELHKLHLGF